MEFEDIGIEKEIEVNKEILKNPYESVLRFAENRLKHVGHKIFSYLALMPVSLVAPDLQYEDTNIRSNIHVMLLSPPGSGKSFAESILRKISLNPFDFTAITSAATEEELYGMKYCTILVQDMAKIISDRLMVKTLEGLCGEERRAGSITISRGDKRFNIDVVALLAGVPSDISAYISGGLIFRFAPILIMHSKETHDRIGKEIAMSIGKGGKIHNISEINNLYRFIYQVQLGKNKDFSKIDGYIFDDLQRSNIYKRWKETLDSTNPDGAFNWFRELISGFRYMAASSILNLNNRKIETEKNKRYIIPNKQDLKVGMFLMANEIRLKSYLLKCDKIAKRIKDIKYLEKYKERDRINNFTFDLLKILLRK